MVLVELTLQREGVAVGWTLCDAKAGQMLVQVMNINKHEVVLGPCEWVADVYPIQEVKASYESSRWT